MAKKARNTRQEILDAAERLIEAEGIMRLTTREIAREANCAEGTLFKYFKRKEDICLAVVLENAPGFRDTIGQLRPGDSTLARNLMVMGLAALDFFRKLIPLTTALFADVDLLRRHRKVMEKEGRGPGDVFALIAAYIRGEQSLRRINSNVVPLTAAALLLGPCFHRVLIQQSTGKALPSSSDRKFVTDLVHAMVSGLSASS